VTGWLYAVPELWRCFQGLLLKHEIFLVETALPTKTIHLLLQHTLFVFSFLPQTNSVFLI